MRNRTIPPGLGNPSISAIESVWETYRVNQKFRVSDHAVRTAFMNFPGNRSEAYVRLKACVLNDVYSTNMVDTGAIARHIASLRIDRRLKNHDHRLVNDIADVTQSGGARRAYSFASKYCALHEPRGFAIYDSFVDKLLWAFQNRDEFSDFHRKDLKDYPRFMEILTDFRHYYGLNRVSLRKLDKYLWLHGKKVFE